MLCRQKNVVNAGRNNMLIRLFFDAGRSWQSLYFSDVSEQQANKIRSAFRFSSLPQCWRNVVVSEKDDILEVKADFRYRVSFDCLKGKGENIDAWRERAREMNTGIVKLSKQQMVNEMLANEACAKMDCCAQYLKSGKCKNPFVVENLGQVLLPHLYSRVK